MAGAKWKQLFRPRLADGSTGVDALRNTLELARLAEAFG
jgi:hypothetical protein